MKERFRMLYFGIVLLMAVWGVCICVVMHEELQRVEREYEARFQKMVDESKMETYRWGEGGSYEELTVHIKTDGSARSFVLGPLSHEVIEQIDTLSTEEFIRLNPEQELDVRAKWGEQGRLPR